MMHHCPIPRPIRQGAGSLWRGITGLHRSWRRSVSSIEEHPILVVGSLRAGGTAKTDWVDWIASRDPGRAILVHPTGDEDRWLEARHHGRVFRAGSFQRAWRQAREKGFERAITDGGLQDPWLDRCPAILLGPDRVPVSELHPFGPFRQARPSRSVDLHLREGEEWTWTFALDLPAGTSAILGAAVAMTESVAKDLRSLGIDVVGVLATRDHKPFDERRIRMLEESHPVAVWVLTAKDASRGEIRRLRSPVSILHRTLEVSPGLVKRLDTLLGL